MGGMTFLFIFQTLIHIIVSSSSSRMLTWFSSLIANPVEYLLAGFAGCLNVVAHLVAREQGIDLKSLKISVDGDINPARLLGLSSDDRAGFQSLRVHLIPDTDATPVAIKKWLETVEDRCPVRDNLANHTPLHIGVQLVPA